MDKSITLEELHKTLSTEKINNLLKNNKNRLITKDYIKKTLEVFGLSHIPNDIKLFQLAMTHTSYIEKDYTDIKNFKTLFTNHGDVMEEYKKISNNMDELAIPLQKKSYDVLEFRGDALLKDIITDYLVCRYDSFNPKELTRLRSLLEERNSFSNICKMIGLHKYALISKNLEFMSARESNLKLQCDLFEAFMGALYYDICGISLNDFGKNLTLMKINRETAYQKCYQFIIRLIEDSDNSGWDLSSLLEVNTNYKDVIQGYYNKNKWGFPVYKVIDIIDSKEQSNKKIYEVGIYDNTKNIVATGKSTSKQMAEKLAARNALIKFNVDFKNEENDEETIELPKNSMVILNV
jgi:ribonuclease-3